MRQVLAELHSLITELEDQGLVAEASTLQDVFVKIAAEDDDSAFQADFDAMMGKYGAAKILSALADAMGDDDMGGDDEDDTASFAFGDEPGVDGPSRNKIVGKYSAMYLRSNGTMNPNELAAQASEATGTEVRPEEITSGPGANAKAEMADALGKDFSKMPYGRMSPTG